MRLTYINHLEQELLSALRSANARFAIVGGHAVLCYSPHERADGSLRTLGDLDVLVSPVRSNLECVAQALASIQVHFSAAQLEEAFAAQRLPNLVMHRAQLFPAIAGVETEDVLSAATEVPSGLGTLPVISREHLLLAKKAAGRKKDLDDVAALEPEARFGPAA